MTCQVTEVIWQTTTPKSEETSEFGEYSGDPLAESEAARAKNWQEYLNGNFDKLLEADSGVTGERETLELQS
jgi:hypothetical protein